MSTLAQDIDGDISFPIVLVTDPAEETAVRLSNRFALFLGEWFLNTLEGVPYYERILGQKEGNLPAVRRLLLNIAENTPGVKEVVSLDLSFDRATRVLTGDLRVLSQTDQIIAGQLGSAFIVE